MLSLRQILGAAALSLAFGAAQAQVPQREYAAHREALAARVQEGAVLVLGAHEPTTDYAVFSQTPPFFYLTGYKEPDAALVMLKRDGALTSTLFVLPREAGREVWTGRRLGTDGATRLTGLPARTNDQLTSYLDSLAGAGLPLYVVGNAGEAGTPVEDSLYVAALRARHSDLKVTDISQLAILQRGKKSPSELAMIKKAVDITVQAQREAIRAIKPGQNEYEIQALIEYTFRRNGADRPSFATIVGSGPNSTTLHYNADDRTMNAGEVVVMDIGASYEGYAADVTRTVPIGGKYSEQEREIYEVVRGAQAAAERQAKLGMAAHVMNDSANAALSFGLAKLGLIESPLSTYDCGRGGTAKCPQRGLYYMHGLGHGIGLDVHDPDQYYMSGKLEAGSAFTLEPGVYVREDVLETLPDTPRNRVLKERLAPRVAKYKNIGVRIEDDYTCSETSCEWISRAPREWQEIEAMMKGNGVRP